MLKNISPEKWGPYFWQAMHYLTVAYPDNPTENDKNNVRNFFESVKNILPCERCRSHFLMHLKKYPLSDNVLMSKYNLVNWLLNIHNEVNIMNGKSTWTYNDIIKKYDTIEQQDFHVEIATILLLILIIIIVCVYMFYKKKINNM